MSAFAAIAFFLVVTGFIHVMIRSGDAAVAALPPAASASEPFDITLNTSEFTPDQKQTADIADQIPDAVVEARPAPHKVLTSGMTMTVSDTPPEHAVSEAVGVARLTQEGDLRGALRLQHREAEREPANMLYQLTLAILYDHVGDRKDAATLYRQVAQAYDANDPSLPRTLNIRDIRSRADYLAVNEVEATR